MKAAFREPRILASMAVLSIVCVCLGFIIMKCLMWSERKPEPVSQGEVSMACLPDESEKPLKVKSSAVVPILDVEDLENRSRLNLVPNKQWKDISSDLQVNVMHEFKFKLETIAHLTPEELFRILDTSYTKEVSIGDFTRKLKSMNLGMSEKNIHYLAQIMDEDCSGGISIKEYYFAL